VNHWLVICQHPAPNVGEQELGDCLGDAVTVGNVEDVNDSHVVAPCPLDGAMAGSSAPLTLEPHNSFVCFSYHQRDEVLYVIGDALGVTAVNINGGRLGIEMHKVQAITCHWGCK